MRVLKRANAKTQKTPSVVRRHTKTDDNRLLAFTDQDMEGVPYSLKEYLELVDWSGRAVRQNKRGHIPENTPPILKRLGMEAAPVLDCLSRKEKPSNAAIGPVSRLRAFAKSVGQQFIKGQSLGKHLCPERA